MQRFVGPPHVLTVDINDEEALRRAYKQAMELQVGGAGLALKIRPRELGTHCTFCRSVALCPTSSPSWACWSGCT